MLGTQDNKLKPNFQFTKATDPGDNFVRLDPVSIPIGIHSVNIALKKTCVFF